MSHHMDLLWQGLPGPAGFFDALCGQMEKGSLILCLEDPIPWPETFREELAQRVPLPLCRLSGAGEGCPGDLILRSFFTPRQRACYFPDESYGTYLSRLDTEARIVHITGVTEPNQLVRWEALIEDYRGPLRFLVEYHGSSVSRGVPVLTHRVNPNELQAYALLLATKLSNTALVRYQAELAYRLSGCNPQLCAELLLLGKKLLEDPAVCGSDPLLVQSACQRAAMTAVFPIIEECRFRFICRHRDVIALHLPIRNIGGELIDDPYDLEIGPLHYLVRYQPLLQSLEGSELIRLCAAMRNRIAHNKPVQPETLRVLMDAAADMK